MNLFTLAKQIHPSTVSKFWRAVIEFNLVQEKDRIAIGFSGGKDSLFLLFLFCLLKDKFPFAFDLEAFHIDNDFADPITKESMQTSLQKYCKDLGISLTIHTLPMKDIWKKQGEKSPCYICAKHRRGALANLATQKGFNKVALAHHQDDVIETFVMNLFESGQISTFSPLSFMDRSQITVIRPLVFMEASEIIEATQSLPWPPLKNPCPYDTKTQRIKWRNWLEQQEEAESGLKQKLFRAIRKDQIKELWPQKPTREELKNNFECFWKK